MFWKLCLGVCLLSLIVQTFVIDNKSDNAATEMFKYDLSKAEELFSQFIKDFSKQYKDVNEYTLRLEIFKDNLRDINERNKAEDGAVYGITQFTDLTHEEFVQSYTGFKLDLESENITIEEQVLFNYNVPDQLNWIEKGLVGEVRNQGLKCQSCWSFAATGVVYGQQAKKHGKNILLSAQQLVDCFPEGGGCRTGSYPHLAFRAAAKMGGFMSEADYPYTGREAKCKFSKNKVVAKLSGGKQIRVQSEEHLKQLVYEYGPIAIGLHAGRGWPQYRGGVASSSTLGCGPRPRANHAVLIVGYGIENGTPFWIIQNSAGKTWGEKGYIRLLRGRNTCNMMSYIATADV